MNEPLALIIEDEADLADIFSEALKAAGYATESIPSGDLAQRRLTEIVPAMIILDLHLPGVDGVQLLCQIRADERIKHCTVIITTADHNMATALPAHADLILLKPIRFGQLRDLASRFKPAIPS